MDAPQVISIVNNAGFKLAAKGNKLLVNPSTALPPELRELLHRHKAELLNLLTTGEYHVIRDGVTVATARNRADAMQALGEAVQAVTTRPPKHTLTILLVDESGKRLRSCYLPPFDKKPPQA